MKNFNKYLLLLGVIFTLAIFIGCESDEEQSEVLKNRDTAGVMMSIGGSSSLLGVPSNPSDLSTSEVSISVNNLVMNLTMVSGTTDEVDHFEIIKQYNGGTEVSMGTFNEFPHSLNLTTLDEFLDGTGAAETDLRIGDVISFTVKVVQDDGDEYYYRNQSFNVIVNCYADLSGTYTMTNSVCSSSVTVTISQNADGSWYLDTADGGLLQYCSTNSSYQNDGNIFIICGEVQPSSDVAFCGGYGIGCILGGTWDQENGILTLQNGNDFFSWADPEYTSTYVKQ